MPTSVYQITRSARNDKALSMFIDDLKYPTPKLIGGTEVYGPDVYRRCSPHEVYQWDAYQDPPRGLAFGFGLS